MKKHSILVAILLAVPVCVFGQTPDARAIIEAPVLSYRALSYEKASLEVTQKDRNSESTETYTIETKREGDRTSTILTTARRGKSITLITESGRFFGSGKYVRRRGADPEDVSTSNPGQLLPNIGLAFSDIRDYLLVAELEHFTHTFISSSDDGCERIESIPKSDRDVYYTGKKMEICEKKIRDIRFFDGDDLVKTIFFTDFIEGEGWWRPGRIQVNDITNRFSVEIVFTYEETRK